MNRQELQAWRNYKAAEMIEEIQDTITGIDKMTGAMECTKTATEEQIDDLNELRMLMKRASEIATRVEVRALTEAAARALNK